MICVLRLTFSIKSLLSVGQRPLREQLELLAKRALAGLAGPQQQHLDYDTNIYHRGKIIATTQTQQRHIITAAAAAHNGMMYD